MNIFGVRRVRKNPSGLWEIKTTFANFESSSFVGAFWTLFRHRLMNFLQGGSFED